MGLSDQAENHVRSPWFGKLGRGVEIGVVEKLRS